MAAAIWGAGSAPLAFALYHGMCLLGWRALRGTGRREPGRVLPWWWLAGVPAAALLGAWGTWGVAGEWLLDPPRFRAALAQMGAGPGAFWWLFPYFGLVNPLVEELFWRDGVLPALRRGGWSDARAASVSSLLFGAWHAVPVARLVPAATAAMSVAGIAAVGWALAWVVLRGGRRRDVVWLHAAAADAPLLATLWLASSE